MEKNTRLIVLDLDNTLWGGVIGEDGLEGIQLGGDFPGNAFKDFQRLLKLLSDQGIALALCSKNDEDVALDAISNHADMLIKEDQISAHRINWEPKWKNIVEIANELNLGLSSILFIDDNNMERESVRLNLPSVKVLDLPDDVTNYSEALLNSPWIERLSVGVEDKQRIASYQIRNKILNEQASAASIDDFLKSLNLNIYFSPLNSSNLARAAQLCQKTNQFNTTTVRYSSQDLLALQDNGNEVIIIGMSDKYSDRENIGLIVLKHDTDINAIDINLFLLSCRVLGRTVENVTLQWIINRAFSNGIKTVTGSILETDRNTPVRSLYKENGFTEGSVAGSWQKNRQMRTCFHGLLYMMNFKNIWCIK